MRMKLMQDSSLYGHSLDFKAEAMLKGRYGPIPGIEPGTTFEKRKDCAAAGVHAVGYAGIHGSASGGAYSVCLSGQYEDDKDEGDFFIYTGTGGQRDSYQGDKKHVGDQTFGHPSNASLLKSIELKRPVRVVRGYKSNPRWAPPSGYRYDGLYIVEDAYYAEGISGHKVCKFEFRKM